MPHVETANSEGAQKSRVAQKALAIEAAVAAKKLGLEHEYAELMVKFDRAREALESIPVDPSSHWWRYRARVLKETAPHA